MKGDDDNNEAQAVQRIPGDPIDRPREERLARRAEQSDDDEETAAKSRAKSK
jgi:hypothetical protein